MEAASVKDLRAELKNRSPKELETICLELAKFKKDSKEYLTYLLFEASDQQAFVRSSMEEMDLGFASVNPYRAYIAKKEIRKVLRNVKKNIRFSKQPETEVALLLHFCRHMRKFRALWDMDPVIENMYHRQMEMAQKKLPKLHEDLQYDYQREIDEIESKGY